jgi:outer membrane protein
MNKHVLIFLCAALTTGAVHAADLLEIFNLAVSNDPALQEARAIYNASHTAVAQKRAALLPSLNIGANTSRDTRARAAVHRFGDGYNSKGYGLSLQQSLVDVAAWYDLQAAHKQDEAEAIRLMQVEQKLIEKVADAYFDVLGSQENLHTYQAEQAASLKVLDQTQQRFDVGLIGITDVYDSKANADTARVNTLLEQNRYKQSLELLESITGQVHADVAGLSAEFPITSVDPASSREWEQLAQKENLGVQLAQLELASKQQEAKAARAALLPTLNLDVSYNWYQSDLVVATFFPGAANEQSNVKLSFKMPVFTGGLTSARKRQAYYARDASEARLLKTQRDNTLNIRNAYRSVETDVEAIAAYAQAVLSAQRALAATEIGVEAGTRNVVDVVIAQGHLYQAQRNHANARFLYVKDSLALKLAAGVLSPQDVLALNQWLQR